MKILIVDDEPLALMRLQKMLETEGYSSLITAKNGKQALDQVKKHHPHVVFLDIEMPVLNGIDAAKEIKTISPETIIVFCTAYDEFALKAFDLSVSDYLLKPVSQERLKQSLGKISPQNEALTITFTKGKDLISLPIDEVYCLVSEDKMTYMYCSIGKVLVDDSLTNYEKKFPNELLRINRNALINLSELVGIHREKSHAFAILNQTEYLPQISRRNLATIKEILK